MLSHVLAESSDYMGPVKYSQKGNNWNLLYCIIRREITPTYLANSSWKMQFAIVYILI